MMRGWLLVAALGFAAATGRPAGAADPPYLGDMPKLYPKAFALWGKTLPRSLGSPPWMRRLEGVVTPIRSVTVDGQPWLFGTACVPHDCGGNILGLLFTPRQDKVLGVATLTGDNGAPTAVTVGDMPAGTTACIRHLTEHPEASACP